MSRRRIPVIIVNRLVNQPINHSTSHHSRLHFAAFTVFIINVCFSADRAMSWIVTCIRIAENDFPGVIPHVILNYDL